jgi:hypothetical protein
MKKRKEDRKGRRKEGRKGYHLEVFHCDRRFFDPAQYVHNCPLGEPGRKGGTGGRDGREEEK